jgi:hypothetical protein
MKKQTNIEKQLNRLKSGYKMPDNYFESFETKMLAKTNEMSKKRKIFSIKNNLAKMMIAASIMLMISVGYYQYQSNLNRNYLVFDTINKQKQTIVQDDLFSDLTDEEIIEYLTDENDLEFDVE